MKHIEDTYRSCWWSLLVMLALVALILLTSSCTTTKYIPMPEYHEVEHHHTDSIYERDSTYHEKETVIMQLDSAAMAQYGIQLKAAERAWLVRTAELERRLQQLAETHTDTVHEKDSIPYPVEVPVEVPAQLTWWQQAKIHTGGIVIYGLLFLGVFWLAKKYFFKI